VVKTEADIISEFNLARERDILYISELAEDLIQEIERVSAFVLADETGNSQSKFKVDLVRR
jgi:hypothetical protein